MQRRIGAGAAILKDKKILLLKRNDYTKDFPHCWTFPAGRMDPEDKSLEETVIREVKEETNLDFQPTGKLNFYECHVNGIHILSHVFLGDWSGEITPQAEEVEDHGWFSYEDTKNLELAYAYAETIEDLHTQGLL